MTPAWCWECLKGCLNPGQNVRRTLSLHRAESSTISHWSLFCFEIPTLITPPLEVLPAISLA